MIEKQTRRKGMKKWTPDHDEKAWWYVNGGFEELGHAIPSIVGLARLLGVSRQGMYDWAKMEETDFKNIMSACNEEQELVLLNGSLKNELNCNIAKLALGKHGYHDKQDTRMDANVSLSDLSDEQLDAKLKALVDAATKQI